MKDKKWYKREEYNSLTQQGVVVEDPHFVVKFKDQCYGTERWGPNMVVDALSWQAGCSVSGSKQWEYDNAGEIVKIYDRANNHFRWDDLGVWLDTWTVGSVEKALGIAKNRLPVKTRRGKEAMILGVDGKSQDNWIRFFLCQDGEYVMELDCSLIPHPRRLKEIEKEE